MGKSTISMAASPHHARGHRTWPGAVHFLALDSSKGTGLGGGHGERPRAGDQTERLGCLAN